MRLNEDACLRMEGSRVVLVPYTRGHVDVYHGWMKCAELRRLTCSERLSFEEEVSNQVSWREDPKKLTFIILDADTGRMCGDVNLYVSAEDTDAEIEVMIADAAFRRRGMARDALVLMINYVRSNLKGISKLVAKILQDNTPSVKLFQKIGFKHVRDLKVFEEVHYGMELGDGNGITVPVLDAAKWTEEKYSESPYAQMTYKADGDIPE